MAGTGGSVAAQAADAEYEILCDDNGPFLRRYTTGGGVPVDTDLDGADYVPVGTVGVCQAAANPQVSATLQRQTGAGAVNVAAGARSVTVTVLAGAPTVAIGAAAPVPLAPGSWTWGIDRGGDSGEALADAVAVTGVAGSDFTVHTTREL